MMKIHSRSQKLPMIQNFMSSISYATKKKVFLRKIENKLYHTKKYFNEKINLFFVFP